MKNLYDASEDDFLDEDDFHEESLVIPVDPAHRFIEKENCLIDSRNNFYFPLARMNEFINIKINQNSRYPTIMVHYLNRNNEPDTIEFDYNSGFYSSSEIAQIETLLKNGIRKRKKNELFKELLKVNPVATVAELWQRAEEALVIMETN